MKEAVLSFIAIVLVTYDSASNAISVHHINHFALQPVRSSLHLGRMHWVSYRSCSKFHLCTLHIIPVAWLPPHPTEAVESRLRRPLWDSSL